MIDLRSGIKIYGSDWYLKYRLEPEAAAQTLDDRRATHVGTCSVNSARRASGSNSDGSTSCGKPG